MCIMAVVRNQGGKNMKPGKLYLNNYACFYIRVGTEEQISDYPKTIKEQKRELKKFIKQSNKKVPNIFLNNKEGK